MKLRRPRRRPSVSVNAMADIAFLLLIFIMLISLINYRAEIPIEYPEAEQPELTNAEVDLELWIRSDGQLFWDGLEVSLATAQGLIADEVARNPSARVHILADRNTPYRHVHGVLDMLQVLQHRVVSLVVEER